MPRNGWSAVFASTLALIVGQGAINLFSAGVFVKPVTDELGFGRGVMGTAVGVSSLVTALATPFFGKLVDTAGVRRTLLTSIVLFALATAALSLLQPSPFVLFGLFGISGLFAVGQNPTAYSKVIVAWFDRRRGLALGITLAGVGLGTALVPQLSAWLIGHYGWRMAYVGLGTAIFIVAFIPVALFLHEPPKPAAQTAEMPGLTLAEAVRGSRQYWAFTIAFLFAAMTINGSLANLVPLLTDRGIPLAAAARFGLASGLALIGGRIVAGYIIDRVFAPYVAIFFLLCPMAGIAILISGAGGAPLVMAPVLLGAGVGAEIDLMSFIIGRYFGTRAFGALHGFMFAVFLIGQAAGISVLGWSFQSLHSYVPGFALFEAALAAACILLATVGPYRYPAEYSAAAG